MRVADAAVNTTVSQQAQPGFPCEPAPELLLTRWGSVGSSLFGRLALRRVRLGAAEKAEEEFPRRLPRGTFTRLRIRMCPSRLRFTHGS